MKCNYCGSEIPDTAKFCPNCGTKIEPKVENEIEKPEYETLEAENPEYEKPMYEDPNQNVTEDSYTNEYHYGQSQESNYTYGTNAPGGNNYSGYHSTVGTEPKVSGTPYIIFGILVTLCCCLPLGIATIVFGSRIDSYERAGDHEAAKKCAKKAKWICIIGAVGGFFASIALGVIGSYGAYSSGEIENVVEEIVGNNDTEEKEEIEESENVDSNSEVILEDSWESFTIEINGKTIKFPCEYDELEETGLKLEDGSSEDDLVEADSYEQMFFDDKNGNYVLITLSNNGSEEKKLSECVVTGIYMDGSNQEFKGLDIKFPGEIQIGSLIDDVIAKWGKTPEVYEEDEWATYSWFNDKYQYSTVTIDNETKQVESIDLDCSSY